MKRLSEVYPNVYSCTLYRVFWMVWDAPFADAAGIESQLRFVILGEKGHERVNEVHHRSRHCYKCL